MKLKLAILVALSFCGVLAATQGRHLARNFHGYCADKQTYISTPEMYDAAIREVINRQNAKCVGNGELWSCERRVRYADMAEFKEKNTDCCRIGRSPEDPRPSPYDFLLRLAGESAGFVSVNYLQHDRAPGGAISQRKVTESFVITNCGRARPPW